MAGATLLSAQFIDAPQHLGVLPIQPEFPKTSLPTERREDWSVPAVDTTVLQPLSSAVLGTSEQPGFIRELVRVQWRAGDPIDLFVVRPRGVAKPPVILYLYSYPDDTSRFWNDGWCRRATQDGFAAVGFIPALTGQRYVSRPMKEWFVSQLQESLGTTTHDVQMILNYLAKRGDLAAEKVGMYGQGAGGTIALLAASADPRIAVVDVLDPWGDWPEWFRASAAVPDEERPVYLKPEFLNSVATLDPVLYLPGMKLQALRLQQTLNERATPAVAKAKLQKAMPYSSQFLAYADEQEHQKEWRINGLAGWIRERMHPSTKASPQAGHQNGNRED